MNSVTLTGFADEIAPAFDDQLAALLEFRLTHLELRSADGVNVSDFSPEKLREIKAKLDTAGIAVSSIGSPIGKIGLTDPFAPHLEKLKRTLEIQKKLNAPYLRMFSFYLPQGADPQDCRAEVLDRVGTMAEEAARWEAVLLHENEKGIYGDTAARCLDLMEELGGPQLKAVFDFANFVEVGQPTLPAYESLKPFIAYVHVKDCVAETRRIVPAGRGDGHVPEILGDLRPRGWTGFLSLEPHLVDFAGLSALEKDPQKRDARLDGKSAWKLALDALLEVLANLPEGA